MCIQWQFNVTTSRDPQIKRFSSLGRNKIWSRSAERWNNRRKPNARDDLIENIWRRNFLSFSLFSSFIVHYTIAIDWLCSHPEAEQQRSVEQMFMIYNLFSVCVLNVWKLVFQPEEVSDDRNKLFLMYFLFFSSFHRTLQTVQSFPHRWWCLNICFILPRINKKKRNLCLIRFSPTAQIMNSTFSSVIWITKLLMMRTSPAQFLIRPATSFGGTSELQTFKCHDK